MQVIRLKSHGPTGHVRASDTGHVRCRRLRHARRPSRQCGSSGCAPLAAQDRVRGTRRWAAQLGGRDPADPAVEAGLLEDRLGELGPGALAARRDVVRAVRKLEDVLRRLREMADERRRAALVVDDRHLVLLRAELEHRPHEVLARPAEEPRGAHDPALAHLALALELRPPVDRQGPSARRTRRTAPAFEPSKT